MHDDLFFLKIQSIGDSLWKVGEYLSGRHAVGADKLVVEWVQETDLDQGIICGCGWDTRQGSNDLRQGAGDAAGHCRCRRALGSSWNGLNVDRR